MNIGISRAFRTKDNWRAASREKLVFSRVFNLRRDPYEQATITSNLYHEWQLDRAYLLVPAQAYVGKFLETFREYPPRMKAASFSVDQVMKKLSSPGER